MNDELYFEIQIPEEELDKGGQVAFNVLDRAAGVIRALVPVKKEEFEKTVKLIPYLVSKLQNQINSLDPQPDKVTLEFGTSLSKEKILFFGSGTNNHFKINIQWDKLNLKDKSNL